MIVKVEAGKNLIEDRNSNTVTKVPELVSPSTTALDAGLPDPPKTGWKEQAQRLQKEAHVFYFVVKHPETRWYARLVAGCTAAYLFSPIQLIPNYIPVIGVMDDFLVVFLGVKLLQKITPAHVLTECRELADAAEARRKEKIRSRAAVIASTVVITLWFLVAVVASVLMAKYFRHR
jgi:uncharacterized membrane protein YkvA (DUF1232 family)